MKSDPVSFSILVILCTVMAILPVTAVVMHRHSPVVLVCNYIHCDFMLSIVLRERCTGADGKSLKKKMTVTARTRTRETSTATTYKS